MTGRGGARGRASRQVRAAQIGVFVLVLLVWLLVNQLGLIDRAVLPSLPGTAVEVVQAGTQTALWVALGQTLAGGLAGLAIAAATGVTVGLLIGAAKVAYRVSFVPVEFFRSFPSVALLPLFVLILGATLQMKIVMVAAAAVWPILVQTTQGVQRVDATLYDAVKSYRISRLRTFAAVLVPQASPFILTGLRFASTLAVLTAIAVEIVSAAPGIGTLIRTSQEFASTELTFAYVFYAALLSVAVGLFWRVVDRRLLSWYRHSRSET